MSPACVACYSVFLLVAILPALHQTAIDVKPANDNPKVHSSGLACLKMLSWQSLVLPLADKVSCLAAELDE